MKRLYFVIVIGVIAIFISSPAFSGTKAGDKSLAVGASLSHHNDSGYTETSFRMNIKYGYFFTDSFVAGFSLSPSYSKTKYGGGSDTDSYSVPGSVFGRFFFGGNSDTVPFIGAEFGLRYNYYDSGNSDGSNTSLLIGPEIGFQQFLSENTALELAYQPQWYKPNEDADFEVTHYFNAGLAFYF